MDKHDSRDALDSEKIIQKKHKRYWVLRSIKGWDQGLKLHNRQEIGQDESGLRKNAEAKRSHSPIKIDSTDLAQCVAYHNPLSEPLLHRKTSLTEEQGFKLHAGLPSTQKNSFL